MKLLTGSLLVVVGLFLPAPAFAHHAMGGLTPQTFVQGLLSGIAHPVIGLDHFLFLLMAGVLAYSLRSPLNYTTPVLFLVSALVGTSLHLAEFNLTNAEVLIALSLIASGGLVLWRRRVSILVLSLFFAVVGLFHGYAYAESIVGAENTPLLAYLVGLALVQYAVIVGMMTGLNRVNRLATGVHPERFAGRAALLGGALFLALSVV